MSCTILLKPLDGVDQPIPVPGGKTTIGRGPYLRVPDKKVSRNHATMEIDDGGRLILTPIHVNPCFFRKGGGAEQVVLPKDKSLQLEEGDVFGLLPDQYFFRVSYENDKNGKVQTKEENSNGEAVENHVKSNTSNGHMDNEGGASKTPAPDSDNTDNSKQATDDVAPTEKKRKLPDWMVTADGSPAKKGKTENDGVKVPAKRGRKPKPKKEEVSDEEEEVVKTPQKRGRPKGSTKKKKKEARSSEDEVSEEEVIRTPVRRGRPPKAPTPKKKEHDVSDEESEEEEEEEQEEKEKKTPPKRGRGRPPASKKKKPEAESPGESGDEDDYSSRPRPSRQASQLKSKYDEDYASNDEFSEPSDDYKPSGGDSDFVAEAENDSGSDWGATRGSRKGKGRGKARAPPSRRTPKRAAKQRKRYSDSELSDEDFDEYIPRPSKRRAAAAAAVAATRAQQREEEEDEDDEKPSDSDGGPKKDRKSCLFGTNCYRKNPSHFKEYCHPGDSDYEDKEEEDEEDEEEEEDDEGKEGKEKKECPHGTDCNRKNPQHQKEFSHTKKPEKQSAKTGDKGKSEDEGSSEEEHSAGSDEEEEEAGDVVATPKKDAKDLVKTKAA